jgi:hypothetical protein
VDSGFALLASLVVLAALFLLATGTFLAARFELAVGRSHLTSVRALYLAEAGLATLLADTGGASPPTSRIYSLEAGAAVVTVDLLLRVDSLTDLFRVEVEGRPTRPSGRGRARRTVGILVVRRDDGRLVARSGSWQEAFR